MLRKRTGAKPRRLGRGYAPSAPSWPSTTADTASFSSPRRLSRCIERGTSAPIPGQSDNLRQPTALSEHPSPEVVGRCSPKSTSESADERRKPRGNDGNRRSEDRSNGGLALPAVVRSVMGSIPDKDGPPANLKLPNQRGAVPAWESSPFRAGRMSTVSAASGARG